MPEESKAHLASLAASVTASSSSSGSHEHQHPQQPQLIFFDTFSREVADPLALDLIQFRCPVRIHEIRIIPLGARVAANFPNGDRLG